MRWTRLLLVIVAAACASRRAIQPVAPRTSAGAETLAQQGGFPVAGFYQVDGRDATLEEVGKIVAEAVERIEILKGPTAVSIYGERARAGAIIVTTKHAKPASGQ
jgi:TonB-dependent SusC/RagA subfamily outer membrane receptor